MLIYGKSFNIVLHRNKNASANGGRVKTANIKK